MLQFQGFPTLDAPDGILRAWYFEPFVAIVSFTFWIYFWWREEHRIGASRSKQWDLLGDGLMPIGAYCVGIYIWKLFVPPAAGFIPDGIPTSFSDLVYLFAEVSTGIISYDFIFFFIHWGMHGLPFLRRFHHVHHNLPSENVEACDVVHHSVIDGSFQVLVNILVQRKTPWGVPKTRLARILHNIIVTSMLTESHSSSPKPYIWRRWFVGIREHRRHHLQDLSKRDASRSSEASQAKFDRHQQFFGYLDDLRFHFLNWRIRARVQSSKQVPRH